MKSTVFWNITSCNLIETYCSFGEIYCLHLQIGRIDIRKYSRSEACIPGENAFLRIDGKILPVYTASPETPLFCIICPSHLYCDVSDPLADTNVRRKQFLSEGMRGCVNSGQLLPSASLQFLCCTVFFIVSLDVPLHIVCYHYNV
jgi:hypothetical protein